MASQRDVWAFKLEFHPLDIVNIDLLVESLFYYYPQPQFDGRYIQNKALLFI